ncbi:hypothetical protein [Paenibacillus abyssi]|uniref:Uncharacterized protein n=1 Tax=Paenibacillus abyssi TaxID=1340531 RepID=A0A917FXT7_9BACL|nr:hypothetical protein [Paenibacillus abyssi]GGG13460.1 hypothetical protein GCM10010916_32970 [Paenibacillus abyssi]
MAKIRTGHVLKFEDGTYYIEESPFITPNLEDAELYFKYFDIMEAQQRADRNTQRNTEMLRIEFQVTYIVPK